ncbi:E3 ubiquitin-protein ligase parkin-like isoform 1-T3 [Glossina fuscipes fuscipes]
MRLSWYLKGSVENRAMYYRSSSGILHLRFYFKCAKHASGGEEDFAAPLNLVKINTEGVHCLACTDIRIFGTNY